MDNKFTEQVGSWLRAPEDERDYTVGALFLLKLSGNQILYRNIISNLEGRKQVIEYQLQKYYNFRVQQLTHEQVQQMAAQVETIAADNQLTAPQPKEPRRDGPAKMGKRDDHDSLPDDIQALWEENLSLLQRMRELHLKLRTLSLEDSPCPDSERYPFLKELIALDKKRLANWEAYDHFVADAPKKTTRKKKETATK